MLTAGGVAAAAPTDQLERYLDLPLVNRDAATSPGGVNPELPYDRATLAQLLDRARREGVEPQRYAALLYQFWLVDVTEAAGIDLASWDPRAGVSANRENLVRSYSYYEQLQLHHRELQWAGMGGLVGADFGGGLVDFELTTNIYDLPGIAQTANAIVGRTLHELGPEAVEMLPEGLRALARAGATITAEDLRYIIGWILVMQKNIFSDLMPMHRAYVTQGVGAIEEMHAAGLFGGRILGAWHDIASGSPDRIASGNAALLNREQSTVIGDQWDLVRAYKGDVGEAVTYLSTVAGSPSVAGVIAPRYFDSIEIGQPLPDGRTAVLTTPLPDWNWSVYEKRWAYITAELLPKYRNMVDNNWPELEARLRVPFEVQLELGRPTRNIPQIMSTALEHTEVTIS
ncbi:MAG: hypothetical protein GX610_18500 [Rhodococcus sp.]|nr:hypothetical protein [Rhodococcus sp. (in: high G+C Gram-positive bacteria)]